MSLDKLQQSLNKKYSEEGGRDKVIKGDNIEDVPVLCSFGSLALDVAIGLGGVPRSRMLEYYGGEGGGKSTISMITAIKAQKEGQNVAIVDLEGTFSNQYFKDLGGVFDQLIYIRPDGAEEAFSILEDLLVSDEIDLVIVDSVAAMLTEAEKEGDYGDSHMAVLARLLSASLKKLTSLMPNYKRMSFIWINQIRSSMKSFKGNEIKTTTGGYGLPHYCSVRLEIKRGEVIGDRDDPDGFRTKIIVRKNKVGPPMRKVEVSLYTGGGKLKKYGIDNDEEIIDVAIGLNVIEKMSKDKTTKELIADENGAWYRIEEGVEFYGRPKLIEYIQANPESVEKLKTTVFAFMSHKIKPSEGSFDDKMDKKERKKRGVKESDTKGESETAVSEDS